MSGGTLEEWHPHLILERPDPVTDRGGCLMETVRRLTEASAFDDHEERFQRFHVEVGNSEIIVHKHPC